MRELSRSQNIVGLISLNVSEVDFADCCRLLDTSSDVCVERASFHSKVVAITSIFFPGVLFRGFLFVFLIGSSYVHRGMEADYPMRSV